MRRLAGLLLALILVAGLAGAGGWGRPESRRNVEEGLEERLFLIPVKDAPVVALEVVLQVGSADDPPGQEGLCWLTMHAAARGGTPSLTAAEVRERFYPMAASVEVLVDREVTVFSGRVRAEDLPEFYPIFRDLLLHPLYEEADIERIRDRSLSRIRNGLRGSRIEELGKEGLQAFLFEGTRLEHPPVGTESGLEAIRTEDVVRFHRQSLVRRRLWMGVAGGYEGSFVERLRSDLSGIPEGSPVPAARIGLEGLPPVTGLEVLLIEKPSGPTAISLGFPHRVRRGHPDYYPLLLATTTLGEHRTFLGRLQREMRVLRGLNYGDYAYLEYFQQDRWSRFPKPNLWRSIPYFSIWIRPVQPENGLFALRQAIWELQHLIEDGLTREEFELTREHIRNLSRLWQQTLLRRIGMTIDDAHDGVENSLTVLRDALDAMTCEQVNEALKRNLTGQDLKAVIVCAQADSIKRLLERGDRTPIVYAGQTAPPEVLAKDEEILAKPLRVTRIEIVSAYSMFE